MVAKSMLQKTLIYNEFSEDSRLKWFTQKRDKFIGHIDTFYYVIYPDAPLWKQDPRKDKLISVLSSAAAAASSSDDQTAPVFQDLYSGLSCHAGIRFNMYSYHFCLKDAFDVFISDFTPNIKTPPIIVQLRSNGLWIKGVKKLFDLSLDCVSRVLASFGLSVEKIVENRFDYAFHTNYIQDPLHFFPDSELNDMQVSQFQRWHKEGDFFADQIRCDYFTLGRRKSNSVFFRVYNKTKEVIDMGYKQFFIPIWYDAGLISNFDRYVLENTFMYGSWNSKERERCRFYLAHGADPVIRKQIECMMSDDNTTYSDYKELADKLVPDVTCICNIEFQCKRKFFYNIQSTIPDLKISDELSIDHIYSLLDQTKSITSYLSYSVIRFVKYKGAYSDLPRHEQPMADWWIRLRSCKQLECDSEEFADYVFSYQSNLDFQRMRNATIKAVARCSSFYHSDDDTSFAEDFYDFVGHMNDNDIEMYSRAKIKASSDLERKKMKLDPAEKKTRDLTYAETRYKSIFYYWISGIYKKRLNPDTFPKILAAAFDAVPESRELFDYITEKYHSGHLDSDVTKYYICMAALKGVDNCV